MGMSASQARFLSLTARKTNTEYEGQQINQQRTALSNESSNYYSKLTSMEVPTPPSSADFTKVSYTFVDGTEKNTVTSLIARKDGLYKLSYVMETPCDDMVTNGTNVITRDGGYKYGAIPLRASSGGLAQAVIDAELAAMEALAAAKPDGETSSSGINYSGITLDTESDEWKNGSFDDRINLIYAALVAAEATADKDAIKGDAIDLLGASMSTSDPKWSTYSTSTKYEKYAEQSSTGTHMSVDEFKQKEKSIPKADLDKMTVEEIENLIKIEELYEAMLEAKYAPQKSWMVRYEKNSATGVYEPVFYSKKELDNADYHATTGASLSGMKAYIYGESTYSQEIKNVTARVEQDASGRFVAIMIYDKNDETGSGEYTRYDLTTTTEADEAGYNDAMNQYYYDKAKYDQEVQEINAKIEIIQVQDKNLELKLKQLDTEENALQTEIDAVKKVISKNVESSFKTFNA